MASRDPENFDQGIIVDLQMTPLFFGLSAPELHTLLADAWTETCVDGNMLFETDQPAAHFFLVLEGHVELFLIEGDRRTVLEIAKRPAVLGEAALLAGGLHPNSARVVGNARLLIVPAASFRNVLDERFDLALLMLGSMSRRLRGLVTQITLLKQKSTAERLAGFLLGLTDKIAGPTEVRFPYDKRLTAESLGMSAESLSRALARLSEMGVESKGDNIVAIADIAVLRVFGAEES